MFMRREKIELREVGGGGGGGGEMKRVGKGGGDQLSLSQGATECAK